MTPAEMKQLLESVDGLSDVHQVTTFAADWKLPSGGSKMVTIEIHDSGAGANRWSVIARDAEGYEVDNYATGNPAGSLETVIATTRWSDLNRPIGE